MAATKRDIFAGNPSADNTLPAVTQTPGGDNSLSARQPFTLPTSVKTDESSVASARERAELQQRFAQAQNASARIEADSGAGGKAI